ncbi:hypothetical protein BDQ17DRAFT_1353712 [Cyathus striatus]|nr:hypothetical protein BDQ17DRAFT_1353712 [Cyathus striatus]
MSTIGDPQGTDISVIFAPIYWGYIVSLLLGGIAIMQSYFYFSRSNDRRFIRILAASVITMDIIDSALVASSVNYYLIRHFGSTLQLKTMIPELTAECLIATIITTISQSYFLIQLIGAKRLGKGSWIVIATVGIFCAFAFAGGIACVVTMQVFHHGVFSDRNMIFSISFGVAKGFSAAADIIATISVCLFLDSARTGMIQMNAALNTLMKYIIQRGTLVTLIQTVLLITFYATPKSVVWFSFHIIIPKLYTNTFFAMLNGRDNIRKLHFGESMKFTGSHSSTNKDNNNTSHDIERGNVSTLLIHKKDVNAVAAHKQDASRALLGSDYDSSKEEGTYIARVL